LFWFLFLSLFSVVVMASSKVARRRHSSLPKEPPASVDISDSDGEKDNGLDDFEIIKTIGKSDLQALWCRVIALFNVS
jgi:hypothetical protein